jgi:outer membrane receptor protein involved in Fe transport
VAHVALQEINDDRRTRDLGSVEEVSEENGDRLIGITLQAVAHWRDWMTFVYGAEIYLDRVSSSRSRRDIETGETAGIASRFPDGSNLNSFAVYVEDEIRPHPDWSVILGGRMNVFAVDIPAVPDRSPAVDRTLSEPTGSLGVEYALTEYLAFASNVGRGFRVPNVFDFAQLGSRPGNRFAEPSPDLEPETALSVDAGVKLQGAELYAEIFGFYLRVDDKIEDLPTGEVRPDGRIVVRGQNVNTVEYAGIELGGRAVVGDFAEPYASVNYTWGEESFADGPMLPADRVPPVNGQVGVLLRPLPSLWIEPYVRFAGSQDRLSGRDRMDPRIDPAGTSAWATVNARAGWWLTDYLEARLTLENIFDTGYREHGSGVDAPGVNVIAGLEAVW